MLLSFMVDGWENMPVQDEIIDIVDQFNQIIGQEPRTYVHERGLLHRSVHGLVFNSSQQLFLQKRAYAKKINPGLWDSSVGGHLHAGETYEQALVRETKEELNFIPENYQFLFQLSSRPITGYEFIRVYAIQFDGEINANQEDVYEGRWFDQAELEILMNLSGGELTSTFKLIHHTYLELEFPIDFNTPSSKLNKSE